MPDVSCRLRLVCVRCLAQNHTHSPLRDMMSALSRTGHEFRIIRSDDFDTIAQISCTTGDGTCQLLKGAC